MHVLLQGVPQYGSQQDEQRFGCGVLLYIHFVGPLRDIAVKYSELSVYRGIDMTYGDLRCGKS